MNRPMLLYWRDMQTKRLVEAEGERERGNDMCHYIRDTPTTYNTVIRGKCTFNYLSVSSDLRIRLVHPGA